MQQRSSVVSNKSVGQPTRHILVLDDNVQLRSLLARHVMLNCDNHGYTCAIYHLGEKPEPRLTYFHQPASPEEKFTQSVPDFAIYEAGSPRHALEWLRYSDISNLTIISDVMMPVDTEVGLPGLLTGLSELKVGVNLVFMSSEPQNIEHVQNMLNGQPAYFLIKGSEAWSQLPEALVRGANRFNYRQLNKQIYNNTAIFRQPELKPNRPSEQAGGNRRIGDPVSNGRRLTTAQAWAGALSTRREAPPSPLPDSTKKPGFWARLFGWGRK